MTADVYAVIRTGGKQHRIAPGQRLRVERLDGQVGDRITFDEVLMVRGDDGEVSVGAPTVDGASVRAEVIGQTRGRKINVFKYKSKTRYRRLRGHRQHHTDLRIEEVAVGERTWTAPERTPPAGEPQPAAEEAAVEDPPSAEAGGDGEPAAEAADDGADGDSAQQEEN